MFSHQSDIEADDIVRLDIFIEQHPGIWTQGQAKWAIYNREYNDLAQSGALSKRGNRWYIVVPRLVEWLTSGER